MHGYPDTMPTAAITRRNFLALTAGAVLLASGCVGRRARPRIGLALGAGGAKGLAHIPLLEALDELGVRPHLIAGTSIGAVIGALYAAGQSGASIRALVEQFLIKRDQAQPDLIPLPHSLRWLDFIDPDFGAGGLLDSADFVAYLGDVMSARRFRDLDIDLKVVAADLWSGEQVVLDSGELLPAIQASMALPGVFRPVAHDKRQLVDGGIANPLPYDLLFEACDLVIAIDVSGDYNIDGDAELSFLGVLFHSFHTMSHNLLVEKLNQRRPDIYIRSSRYGYWSSTKPSRYSGKRCPPSNS
jgi:NTE family protein